VWSRRKGEGYISWPCGTRRGRLSDDLLVICRNVLLRITDCLTSVVSPCPNLGAASNYLLESPKG